MATVRHDPRERLLRPIPGERFLQEGETARQVFQRLEEKEQKELIPRRDLKTGRESQKTRTTRKLAVAGPNAPSLIRLVRYPFRLQTVRGSRQRYYTRPEAVEKVDWQAMFAEAREDRRWVRAPSPVRSRPRAFTILPSRWKILKKVGEGR
jgi:hypothetical protein